MTPFLECGVHKDIPEDFYHSLPYESSTFIKAFADNPFAAKTVPFEGSAFTDLGGACHAFSLQGRDVFNTQYCVLEDIPCPSTRNEKGWKNTSDYKQQKELQEMEADGRVVLSAEQFEAVKGVDKSLREHPSTKLMLNRGMNELTLIWVDEITGLKCKARLDDYFGSIPSDLKTTNDVTWFHSDLYRRRYNLQAGHYSMGCLANGLPVNYFCFLAAQTTATYPIRVGFLHPDKLEHAKAEVSRYLGLIKQCRERDVWPNHKIPAEIYTLEKLTASSLLEEW